MAYRPLADSCVLMFLCSSLLQISVGFTPVNEHVMLERLKLTLCFISLIAVCPYRDVRLEGKEMFMFYAKLDSIVWQFPHATHSSVTGTDGDGYDRVMYA